MSILIFSGRKSSGKDTCTNFVVGLKLLQYEVIKDFIVSEKTNGKLFVQRKSDETYTELDVRSFHVETMGVKVYSYADKLKEICVSLFGLRPEQVYGTDDDKNTLTQYNWESMPGLAETSFAGKTGLMTSREFMEFFGTCVCRRIYDYIWMDYTFYEIDKDTFSNEKLFIINDSRFSHEIHKAHEKSAKIIRLARDPYNAQNEIERALDPDLFDWNQFDHIIRNENYTVRQTLEELYGVVTGWGLVNVEYDFKKERLIN